MGCIPSTLYSVMSMSNSNICLIFHSNRIGYFLLCHSFIIHITYQFLIILQTIYVNFKIGVENGVKRGLIYSSFIDIRDYVFELEELLKKNATLYRIIVDKNRGRDIDTGLLIALILLILSKKC